MNKFIRSTAPVLAAALLLGCFALGSNAEDGDAARKEKIFANLSLQFPQLEKMGAVMGEIKASGFEGLDEGSFAVRGRDQKFLVSSDDTKLYLIQGEALDVSKGAEQIAAEVAERKAKEAKEASERVAKINESIEGRPFLGNADAPVTVVEFSDFQCPYCSRGAATVKQMIEKYPNDVKVVFQHFPLDFHNWAKPAAIAANCASNQSGDAFWTLHDKFFEHQKEIKAENVMAKSREFLADSGIDMATWTACAEDKDTDEYKAASKGVNEDMAFGKSMGVTGTPGFFVNGQFLNGAQPLSAFEPLIKAAKENAG